MMSSVVEIRNIGQIYDGSKVGHKFDIVVENARADGNAKVKWFERTDRKYAALEENEVWEDLFEKFCKSEDASNLFREAYVALPEEGESEREITFTIHDEPCIKIGGSRTSVSGETAMDSRRLDFIIVVQLTENDIHIAVCRQVIEVDEDQKKLIKAEFKTTGFCGKTAEEAEYIYGEVSAFNNTQLTGIFSANELNDLWTVNSFTESD